MLSSCLYSLLNLESGSCSAVGLWYLVSNCCDHWGKAVGKKQMDTFTATLEDEKFNSISDMSFIYKKRIKPTTWFCREVVTHSHEPCLNYFCHLVETETSIWVAALINVLCLSQLEFLWCSYIPPVVVCDPFWRGSFSSAQGKIH